MIRNEYFIRIIILLLVLFSCVERERLNPLDPQNPETGGKPGGLRIYSELHQAVLSWNHVNVNDFIGYKIYRKTEHDTSFRHIYTTSPDSNLYVDQNLAYEVKYYYQISVLATDFESNRSDTVTIIPGPTTIWAGDVYGRRIKKISHDCAHEIESIVFDAYPFSLEREEKNNRLWFSDVLLDRIYFVDGGQYQIFAELNGGELFKIRLDQKNNRLWIGDSYKNKMIIYNLNQTKLKEIDGFTRLSDFEIDEVSGSCLVLDAERGVVQRFAADFTIDLELTGFRYPARIALNQTTGDFWIIDNYQVRKFDATGGEVFLLDHQFNLPKRITVDSENGNCWVADWSYQLAASKLFCFSSQGEKLVEMDGLEWPENLVVNPYDHSCIVADSGNGRFLKVTPEGEIYGSFSRVDYAYGIAVEY